MEVYRLQYADDTILFIEADMNGIQNLKNVIYSFQLVSWAMRKLENK